MSREQQPVTITILDKEYMVACPEEERPALIESAKYLNARMREVRDGGKVIGAERIAVITALNIIHEMLTQRREAKEYTAAVGATVQRLRVKVDAALARRPEEETLD